MNNFKFLVLEKELVILSYRGDGSLASGQKFSFENGETENDIISFGYGKLENPENAQVEFVYDIEKLDQEARDYIINL